MADAAEETAGAAEAQATLSRSESSFVLMIRAVWFLWEMTFGICAATRLEKMMGLCTAQAGAAGASALYARQASFAWACCCAAGLLINPLVASLSDTFGRKPFLALTRTGISLWFLSAHWMQSVSAPLAAAPLLRLRLLPRSAVANPRAARRSVGGMMWGEILSWSAFGATITVQNAAFDDVFGDRPEFASQLQAKIGGTTGIGGFLGHPLGILLSTRGLVATAFWLPASMMAAQAALFVLCSPETLPPSKRKPFRYATANPIASIRMLFGNGPGLRRLALAACTYCSCTSTWSTMEPFRADPRGLGWPASWQSAYNSACFLSSAVSQAFFIPWLIQTLGNLGAFKRWSMVAGAAYFCVGQAGRPLGASRLRKSVQYLVPAIVLQDPWTDPCSYPIRALVVKEGIDLGIGGRGEVAAAYDGITDMVGCFMPLVWGWLFGFFSSPPSSGWLGRVAGVLGFGGHLALAAELRISGGVIVSTITGKMLASAQDGEAPKEAS